jgi:hypothetical protein
MTRSRTRINDEGINGALEKRLQGGDNAKMPMSPKSVFRKDLGFHPKTQDLDGKETEAPQQRLQVYVLSSEIQINSASFIEQKRRKYRKLALLFFFPKSSWSLQKF